jgi:hypothetical protein
LQPSEEGLADLAAPAAHELLVGLTVIKAMSCHSLLRAKASRSNKGGRRRLTVPGHSLRFQAGCFHQVRVSGNFSLHMSSEFGG